MLQKTYMRSSTLSHGEKNQAFVVRHGLYLKSTALFILDLYKQQEGENINSNVKSVTTPTEVTNSINEKILTPPPIDTIASRVVTRRRRREREKTIDVTRRTLGDIPSTPTSRIINESPVSSSSHLSRRQMRARRRTLISDNAVVGTIDIENGLASLSEYHEGSYDLPLQPPVVIPLVNLHQRGQSASPDLVPTVGTPDRVLGESPCQLTWPSQTQETSMNREDLIATSSGDVRPSTSVDVAHIVLVNDSLPPLERNENVRVHVRMNEVRDEGARILENSKQINSSNALQAIANDFIEFARRFQPPAQEERGTNINKGPKNLGALSKTKLATRLQKMYRKNKKRAVQEILKGNRSECKIGISDIQKHFTNIFKAPTLNVDSLPRDFDFGLTDVASNDKLSVVLLPTEVIKKLKFIKNTAPGPDGITYPTLLKADPSGTILSNIYSACIALCAIPDS
ncbi:uncharacterized protein LOC122502873 [Leptopilina heterotoma]|uniref:uncharacterized protein LOC122502873 n=1 Tax=Leptopilina heterotoma TaxID=63436 RepID=UPI001CA8A6AE|nr:uncharacterized protein LOC122502873 [Leptopilina heterotoma]